MAGGSSEAKAQQRKTPFPFGQLTRAPSSRAIRPGKFFNTKRMNS